MTKDLKIYAEEHDKRVLASKTFKRISEIYNLSNKRVLDIGCSTGSHMLRFGKDSVGITTNPKEVTLGKEIGRDLRLGNAERLSETLSTKENFDAIWCNNIFEHLLSPHAFLVNLKKFAHDDTLLILGTPMVPIFTSLMSFKKFRGALASAHVNFFNYNTYKYTVTYAGWKSDLMSPFISDNKIINSFFTPLSPHLYLIAKNNTSYKYHPKKLNEWDNDPLYQPLIEVMNQESQNTQP